jgi:hypothetical protein
VFGSSETKWYKRKISIMITESLVRLMVAAWVISIFA